MEKHTLHLPLLALLGTMMIAAGCSDFKTTPTAVQESYGNSVRNMIAEQTFEPGDEAETLDGEKSEAVLQSYREDLGNPKSVEQREMDIRL